ncbi:hypothetical protein MRX96_014920 [Rhipicephalus microplus]
MQSRFGNGQTARQRAIQRPALTPRAPGPAASVLTEGHRELSAVAPYGMLQPSFWIPRRILDMHTRLQGPSLAAGNGDDGDENGARGSEATHASVTNAINAFKSSPPFLLL